MRNKKVELLAPAGNVEAFYGAIHAGADAVYLGGNRFGARAYADNFTEQELISCIRYAHIFDRKVYLTVNTLIKESELSELYSYLYPFYEAGLDGVIVQDIGVFCYIRECFPDLELHVSTQMTITGKYGASLLKEMGAVRVVPARELNLDEIRTIKDETGLEIETFIHGAMCYCYSGQCLFSSILGGRSGNRGRCAQPCRLPYRVNSENGKKQTGQNKKEYYPLSLKDMCTIEMLPELLEAGIDSFKIEGRMKKPEYAAGVTAIYRKYIDLYYKKGKASKFNISREDLEILSKLYIRSERQDGYYHKHNGKEMITLTNPAYSGSEDSLIAEVRAKYLNKKEKMLISVFASFQVGEPASLTFCYEDKSVTVVGDPVDAASKQPLTAEGIEKQIGKLGDSLFVAESISVETDQNSFYSLKGINELRRQAVSALEDLLITSNGYPVCRTLAVKAITTERKKPESDDLKKDLHVAVRTEEQLDTILHSEFLSGIDRLYVDGDLVNEDALNKLKKLNQRIVIMLPRILRKRDEDYLKKLYQFALDNMTIVEGFSVACLEGFGFLHTMKYAGNIYAEPGFHIWNHSTLDNWYDYLKGFAIPFELNGAEQRRLTEYPINCEKVFYGRIPMMVTANCVAKTMEYCRHSDSVSPEVMYLTDRYQKKFPVALHCKHCMNVIYNSVPISLHGEWKKWQYLADMRLDFTVENGEELRAVMKFFVGVYEGRLMEKEINPPFGEYTTGHEKRGVE